MAKKKTSKKSVKKTRTNKKLYAGKTRKEWRTLGEKFGMGIDSESKNFAKALEDMGRKMEKRGDVVETYWRSWWFDAMGLVGPLAKSVLGIAGFALGLLILNFFNSFLSNGFLYMLYAFLFSNIQWFFLASLFFGYAKYLSLRKPWKWWMFSPSVAALKITFTMWVLASILGVVGSFVVNDSIVTFTRYVIISLPAVTVLIAVIGYALELSRKAIVHAVRRA